ncbi:MerR family transcriptional regulator [Aliiruegeria lutimaris]|uniref:MerR HTH family regulatory protein n=1 Tax=Aliiruegeria lutimaris TaxID=571298 RepID=A0A1G8LJ95_9RHOB|nr:MerR family transcriptional regulator [Aliiruegeria lutimaris]SDI55728.1 MerR HTH family regulatory protein [Aliiruegeria lutimaris]
MNGKSPDAFRTISEVADWLGVNTHVLRFWESKFSQVKPVKRAGGRRYYRPADMELLGGIQKLLHEDGMTIKGVQKVLRDQGVKAVCAMSKPVEEEDENVFATAPPAPAPAQEMESPTPSEQPSAPDLAAAADEPPSQPESDAAPEPEKPRQEEPSMPLFSHHTPSSAPGTPSAPTELSAENDQAPSTQESSETPEADIAAPPDSQAVPDSPAAAARPTAPVIAPLPARDIPLAEALAMLRPRQIAPEKLAPIFAGLVALRERMESHG